MEASLATTVYYVIVSGCLLVSFNILLILLAAYLPSSSSSPVTHTLSRGLKAVACSSVLLFFRIITLFSIVLRYALLPFSRFLASPVPPPVLRPFPSPSVPRAPTLKLAELRRKKLSVSFNGCSWMMVFHLGAAAALVDRLGCEGVEHVRVCGASCGSLVAVALVARVDMGAFKAFVFDMLQVAQTRFFGPVGCMTSFVEGGLRRLLPPGSHKRASGRLRLSISALTPSPKNLVASDFASDDDLVQACLASCYIPVYYEHPRVFRGSVCVDGGLTDNQPVLDAVTWTVNPDAKSGASIAPATPYPSSMCLFPGCRQDLESMYNEGYAACVAKLQREGLVTE